MRKEWFRFVKTSSLLKRNRYTDEGMQLMYANLLSGSVHRLLEKYLRDKCYLKLKTYCLYLNNRSNWLSRPLGPIVINAIK